MTNFLGGDCYEVFITGGRGEKLGLKHIEFTWKVTSTHTRETPVTTASLWEKGVGEERKEIGEGD